MRNVIRVQCVTGQPCICMYKQYFHVVQAILCISSNNSYVYPIVRV